MKYSFVLPAYKAKFLRESIDSILAQTYSDFELIVVNDASPEDIGSIINTYQDKRVKYYVNSKNIGGKNLVSQWNHSILYAQGDYIILASDDDVYAPEYLFKIDILVCMYPDVNIFRPRVRYIDGAGETIDVEGYIKEYCTKAEFFQSYVRGWVGSGIPFYTFKRDALMAIGGFPNYPLAWFTDDSVVLRLATNGVVTVSDILFNFRQSGHNITSKKNSLENLRHKIQATEQFYNEGVDVINNIPPVEDFIKNDLARTFAAFMEKNKIMGQLFNASLGTILILTPQVLRLPFVRLRVLMKYYLVYFYRLVKNI